jgi:hypothetical protein
MASICRVLLTEQETSVKATDSEMFLRNVGYQRITRRYIPEDDTLHNHRCKNLKSHPQSMFLPYSELLSF